MEGAVTNKDKAAELYYMLVVQAFNWHSTHTKSDFFTSCSSGVSVSRLMLPFRCVSVKVCRDVFS